MMPAMKLSKYRCHKIVEAAQILGISVFPHKAGYALSTLEGPIEVSAEYFAKHKPQVGGYFVKYSDDYTSYSPAEAFEQGYNLLEE